MATQDPPDQPNPFPRSPTFMTLEGVGPNHRENIDGLVIMAVREAMQQGKKSSLTLKFSFLPDTDKGAINVEVSTSVSLPTRSGGTAFFWAKGEPGKYTGEVEPLDDRRGRKKTDKPGLSALEGGKQ